MGDGATVFGIKREYVVGVLAVLITSLLWWFFHKPVDGSKAIVKEALEASQQKEVLFKKKNDSLNLEIFYLKEKFKDLQKEETKTNKDYDKIRNNPISDATADSMRSAILSRGKKRFH